MTQQQFIGKGDIFLVDPNSVDPANNNFSNPTQTANRMYAESFKIELSMATDEIKLLGTNGSQVRVYGPEPVELETTITNWSPKFVDSIIGRDSENRVFSKFVTFLVQAQLQTQGLNITEDVQIITFGQFLSGPFVMMEAATAGKLDYTFSVLKLSMKGKGFSLDYNFEG
jgi:hypothetical protein